MIGAGIARHRGSVVRGNGRGRGHLSGSGHHAQYDQHVLVHIRGNVSWQRAKNRVYRLIVFRDSLPPDVEATMQITMKTSKTMEDADKEVEKVR